MKTFLAHPLSMVGSDGSAIPFDTPGEQPHPRSYGTYPRVLGRYVREQGLLTLEHAVHKMTGLSARHMGFTDRGLIKEGFVADLVLFDPETVIDRATAQQPELLSTGITSVWVGGELAYDGDKATGSRSGKAIRRTSMSP